jgi:glutamyl-tRNA reductase
VAVKDSHLQIVVRALAEKSPAPSEIVILSTCNRTEFYTVFPSAAGSQEVMQRFLSDYFDLPADQLIPHLYFQHNDEAIRHLFRVAASVDSMVIGENQIQGQVKHAYFLARELGHVGPVLSNLFEHALHAGKRVRTETNLGRQPVSVSHLAVDLAQQLHGDLQGLRFLLIGTGKMGKLAAEYLHDLGADRLTWISRHPEHRRYELRDLPGEFASYEALTDALRDSDVVISSSHAPHCVLTPEVVKPAVEGRESEITIIDIAMPRDADPALRTLPGVRLFDLEDLYEVACTRLAHLRPEIAAAEEIVAHEASTFVAQLRAERVTPTIVALRKKAEAIRNQELEKALRRLGDLTEREAEIVRALSVGIVNKLLHEPTAALRTAAKSGNAAHLTDSLCRLFNLNGQSDTQIEHSGQTLASQPEVTL